MKSAVALRVAATCSWWLVAACSPPRYNAGYKADVDRVFAAHAGSNREIAAPVALEPRPWKVGEWALYRRAGAYPALGFDGYEKVSVIAEDQCGVWIVEESHDYDDRHRWTLCLRRVSATAELGTDPVDLVQVAIWESNAGSPHVIDFRFGHDVNAKQILRPVITRMLPAQWRDDANLSREDVDVPAGRFLQAIRTSANVGGRMPAAATRWSHPDVPFDATVRRLTSDGRDYILLAYGDSGATGVAPKLVTAPASTMEPKPSSPTFISFGMGYAWFSGHSSEASSQATSFSFIVGARLNPKVDLIGETGGLVDAAYSPDPMQSQSTFIALLGARWAPFRLPYLQPRSFPHGASALFLQADLGYTELLRYSMSDTNTVGRGFVIGVAVGWLGFQARDWALGFEVSDHVAFFNRGEGVRNSLGFVARWQLYLPWER